jgi:hypothetical protein
MRKLIAAITALTVSGLAGCERLPADPADVTVEEPAPLPRVKLGFGQNSGDGVAEPPWDTMWVEVREEIVPLLQNRLRGRLEGRDSLMVFGGYVEPGQGIDPTWKFAFVPSSTGVQWTVGDSKGYMLVVVVGGPLRQREREIVDGNRRSLSYWPVTVYAIEEPEEEEAQEEGT